MSERMTHPYSRTKGTGAYLLSASDPEVFSSIHPMREHPQTCHRGTNTCALYRHTQKHQTCLLNIYTRSEHGLNFVDAERKI